MSLKKRGIVGVAYHTWNPGTGGRIQFKATLGHLLSWTQQDQKSKVILGNRVSLRSAWVT